VIFEDFANVATNVVIFPGITLGEGCVIGAASVVTKSTQPWTIYMGIPSRPVKPRKRTVMIKMAQELGYPRKEKARVQLPKDATD
jgi:acetyltransferase-like isoleucine patch superfamily enzyme